MQRKTVIALVVMLALAMPAMAIELPKDAGPVFDQSSTAYSSSFKFNSLLAAYGLKMDPDAVSGVPSSYAKVVGDEIVFNDNSIAYSPADYHSILTAYGLELLPAAVNEKLVRLSYAIVKNDEISFSDVSTAYGKDEWVTILSAYSLPAVAAPAPAIQADSDGDGVMDASDDCPDTPKGVVVNERGCWAFSDGLLFAFDSSVIKQEFYPVLDETKSAFDQNPTMKVEISGNTDSTGSETYNQRLSEKRAKAVMDYLVQTVGIDPSRLSAVGYGETKPGFPNDTDENRAKNRRVVFTPLM